MLLKLRSLLLLTLLLALALQPPEESGGRAAFLLQLGLRAMSAGNLPSARHRCERHAVN